LNCYPAPEDPRPSPFFQTMYLRELPPPPKRVAPFSAISTYQGPLSATPPPLAGKQFPLFSGGAMASFPFSHPLRGRHLQPPVLDARIFSPTDDQFPLFFRDPFFFSQRVCFSLKGAPLSTLCFVSQKRRPPPLSFGKSVFPQPHRVQFFEERKRTTTHVQAPFVRRSPPYLESTLRSVFYEWILQRASSTNY